MDKKKKNNLLTFEELEKYNKLESFELQLPSRNRKRNRNKSRQVEQDNQDYNYNQRRDQQITKKKRKSRTKTQRKKPREVSSKVKPIKRYSRDKKQEMRRDPRFDSLSSMFHEHHFLEDYSFLVEKREEEIATLRTKLKLASDRQKINKYNRQLSMLIQSNLRAKEKTRANQVIRERNRKEAKLIKKGKRPYFLNRAKKRKLILKDKWDTLTKEGKADKVLKKRRQRKISKKHKYVPRKRDKN
ncbi:hypothetical protein M0813_08547 [Anaeramoeba flamelloides]|uniref:rRNA biogenesis protein RRP36 n=1 Tax=Anaeramoeba flamelloides TaxID=1746091 RepID=A0ABQ8X8Q7_9EUKA|nr:hypothetical protein M0813_08547 [Anaeramoeba flamelloides]